MTHSTHSTHLLHIDASARPGRAGEQPHGSHTRALTHRFVSRWHQARPNDPVTYRDVGLQAPRVVNSHWISAAFTPAPQRDASQQVALNESDALVQELLQSDLLVMGVPMYNFGPPAGFKAWIDNIVRVGLTFGYDPTRGDERYVPLLAERPRRAILLSSRGGNGFEAGQAMAGMNHLDPAVRSALAFLGITDFHTIAVEHEEHGGALLAQSVAQAQLQVDQLVDRLIAEATEATVPSVSQARQMPAAVA